jgi:hypothetical protein
MQQGRVQTDADWNEQVDIDIYNERIALRDIIGRTGAPKENAGFGITPTADATGVGFVIGSGHYYVDGILCENDGQAVSVVDQPDLKPLYFSWDGIFEKKEENQRFREFLKKEFAELKLDWVTSETARTEKIENGQTLRIYDSGSDGDTKSVRITLDNPEPAKAKKATMLIDNPPSDKITRVFVVASQKNGEESSKIKIGYTPSLPGEDGYYIAYLDVRERHLTWLDDPEMREVALGGPDTATRTKVVWQVKLLYLGTDVKNYNCLAPLAAWSQLVQEPNGKLRARAEPTEPAREPCEMPPEAGYRRIENQLYRVEIHDAGVVGKGATFKWSRDNAIWVARVTDVVGGQDNIITINNVAKDNRSRFADGQWIEVVDERRELLGIPGTLAQLVRADELRLVFDPSTVRGDPLDNQHYPQEFKPKVRRWDSAGAIPVAIPLDNDGYIELEDGVQIQFSTNVVTEQPARYLTGNYWTIAARTATNDVEWPRDQGQPQYRVEEGIKHHFARLALLNYANGKLDLVDDCRQFFVPVSSLNLRYVSGDGQEAASGGQLPAKLRAMVTTGDIPFRGVEVKFHIETGADGILSPHTGNDSRTYVATSDAQGLVECAWNLGSAPVSQQVKASILDSVTKEEVLLPVYFNANISSLGPGESYIRTGVIVLTLRPPEGDIKEVIFARDNRNGFSHGLEELNFPPAIILGFISTRQEDVGNGAKSTIKFMEDYELFKVIKTPMRFKAVEIDRRTFKISIDAQAIRELLALGDIGDKKNLWLRWWAIRADKLEGFQDGGPTRASRIATLDVSPRTVALGDTIKVTVRDPSKNIDPSKPDVITIYLAGEAQDRTPVIIGIDVDETGANTETFSFEMKVLRPNVIGIVVVRPPLPPIVEEKELPGAQPGKTIVVMHKIRECDYISKEIEILRRRNGPD